MLNSPAVPVAAPARTLTTPAALIAAGLAEAGRAAELAAIGARYAIAVPPALAALIDRADPADPIARQFVPDARELIADPPKAPIRSATI